MGLRYVAQICRCQSVLDSVAARIASGPTRAFGMFKQLMDADLPLAAQMELERESFAKATATSDFREAAAAFVAKRKPVYRGC